MMRLVEQDDANGLASIHSQMQNGWDNAKHSVPQKSPRPEGDMVGRSARGKSSALSPGMRFGAKSGRSCGLASHGGAAAERCLGCHSAAD
jgi:hypothetical protein